MKQIVAILILLCVLITFVVWNALYINKVAVRMKRLAESLPPVDDPACVAAAEHLRSEWKRTMPVADLSVSYLLTDRICEQTALLASCAAVGDTFGYESARAILSDALEDMRRTERFSFESLF